MDLKVLLMLTKPFGTISGNHQPNIKMHLLSTKLGLGQKDTQIKT